MLLHWLAQFLHPGRASHGGSEWFWGGIGSDVQEVAVIGGVYAMLRHHNCHVDGCLRLGHRDPTVEAPACRRHHSHRHLRGKPRSIS